MKTFSIGLRQETHGSYIGRIEIEAKSKKEALKLLNEMSNDDIDWQAEWEDSGDVEGDVESIEIIEESIEEIK